MFKYEKQEYAYICLKYLKDISIIKDESDNESGESVYS